MNYGIGRSDVQILVKVLLWLQGHLERVSVLEVNCAEIICLLLLNLVKVINRAKVRIEFQRLKVVLFRL